MSFTPERTLPYKTYIKRALVEGLRSVFTSHPDLLLQQTKVSIEYPRTQADYPAVLLKFYERKIMNAGVGHSQDLKLYDPPKPTVTSADGSLPDRWYEYRVSYILADDEETESSEAKRVENPAGGAHFTLTWPAGDVVKYRVYRRSAGTPFHVYWETTDPTYVDNGASGTPGTPLGARKFKHYMWSGDFEFAVYALSNLDRDLIADTLIQTIAMGDLEAFTNSFYARVEPVNSPSVEAYAGSASNFIVLQSDEVVGYGESQAPVPWGSEDDLIYQTSYRIGAYGEFYNLPGRPRPFVEHADLFPYEPGRDVLPTGDPDDDGIWVPAKPTSQADIDAELADDPPLFT